MKNKTVTVKKLIKLLQEEDPKAPVSVRINVKGDTLSAPLEDKEVFNKAGKETGYNYAVDEYADGTVSITGYIS